jgi:hypothetical protein
MLGVKFGSSNGNRVRSDWMQVCVLTESDFSAYQGVSDDSTTSTLTSALGSVVTRLRPDRVFALTTLFAPQNQFKDQ